MFERFRYKTAVHFLIRQAQADGAISEQDMHSMIGLATNDINSRIAVYFLQRDRKKTKFDACCHVFANIISCYISVGITDGVDNADKAKRWNIALEYALRECGFSDQESLDRQKVLMVMGNSFEIEEVNPKQRSPNDIFHIVYNALFSCGGEAFAKEIFDVFCLISKTQMDLGVLNDQMFQSFDENDFSDAEVAIALMDGCVQFVKDYTRDKPIDENVEDGLTGLESAIDFLMENHSCRFVPQNGLYAIRMEAQRDSE